tara:strand:+ start:124 stop:564 length:441 start_codon:yes stop_codon:yes gene_type:complete
MKIKNYLRILKKEFQNFLILTLSIFLFNFHSVCSLEMKQNISQVIYEELVLSVPKEFKEEWLDAERTIWDPWLKNKDGFLGRQVFWNKDKNQGILLVKWETKEKWKRINEEEVTLIQKNYEDRVKRKLNLDHNPFELIYEGELFEQ